MLTASRRFLLRRTREVFFARWGLLDWLRLLWCSLVCWYELASFHYSLSSCTWPDGASHASSEKPAHVLLVADPQVRDLSISRSTGFSALRQYVLDRALERNWHFASRMHPDIVIFLGDILASWRLIRTDEEYERNLRKFKTIFHLDPGVTSYYVPGNNDLGLNIEPSAARQARNRFTTHFGPLNQKVVLRNHTLVLLDAAGLVEEDYLRAAKYIDYEHWKPLPRGTVEFVHSLRDEVQAHPTILFTHIPLHRPDTAPCGPLREKGTIRRGVGHGYQNTLGKKTTAFLLHNLRPRMVFSADDKDYCDYIHVPPKSYGADASSKNITTQNVREVTLKAFAPSSEIRHPGFQLFSLTFPAVTGEHALAHTPCFFPDYHNTYTRRYAPLLFLTTLTLALLRFCKSRTSPLPLHARRGGFRKSFSIHTLPPDAPWVLGPHPPTPFSPDWSPHTPGFANPHAPRSPRPGFSPTDELPQSLRTPFPILGEGKAGDVDYTLGAPATPTFRATTHVRECSDASPSSGPAPFSPGLVVFDASDENEHDEFAHGRHDPRRLSRAERGANADVDVDVAGALSKLSFTFTLGGQRRRISFGSVVPGWARAGLPDRPVAYGRAGSKRGFALRVAMDLMFVAWPAVLLWVLCAWRLR